MGTSLFKARYPIFISFYPKIVSPRTSRSSSKPAPDSFWHVPVILRALPGAGTARRCRFLLCPCRPSNSGIHSSFFSCHISNSLSLRDLAPQILSTFTLCIKSMMSSPTHPHHCLLGDALILACPVPSIRATSPSTHTLPCPYSVPASGFWTGLFRKGKGNHFSHSHLIVYILFF